MKKQLLNTILLAGITVFFYACSSGTGNNSNENETPEEDAVETTEAVEEQTPSMALLVWHEVEDYDQWKSVYDNVEHSPDLDGLSRMVVGQSTDNPNMVFVAEAVHDMEKATAFFESERFKTAAEEAGLVGEPDMSWMDVQHLGPGVSDNNARVWFSMQVGDFDTFKAEFESTGEEEEDNGMDLIAWGRDHEDPNRVSIVCVVTDQAKIESHMKSDYIAQRMEAATIDPESMAKRYFTVVEYNR